MENEMTTDVKKEKPTLKKRVLHHLFVFFVVCLCYAIPMSMHVYSNGGWNESFNTTYTLTNGEKTVVFQGMTHIALPSFYQSVGEDLNDYRSKGFAIFLEGLGHNDDKKLHKGDPQYEAVIEQYKKIVENGREAYSQKMLKNKYVLQYDAMPFYYSYDDSYIDFTTAELKASIDESLNNKKGNDTDKDKIKESYSDTLGNHSEAYKKLLENERTFIISSNLDDFFLFTVVDDHIMPIIRNITNSPDLESDVTMTARNKKITDAINDSTNDHIYIVYGSRHFKGVFDNLQKNDPRWSIVNTSKKAIFKK